MFKPIILIFNAILLIYSAPTPVDNPTSSFRARPIPRSNSKPPTASVLDGRPPSWDMRSPAFTDLTSPKAPQSATYLSTPANKRSDWMNTSLAQINETPYNRPTSSNTFSFNNISSNQAPVQPSEADTPSRQLENRFASVGRFATPASKDDASSVGWKVSTAPTQLARCIYVIMFYIILLYMTVDSTRTRRQVPSMGAHNGFTTALLHYTTVLHKRVSSSGDDHIAEDAGVW